MSDRQFTIFGNKYLMGSYILLIRVSSPFKLAFGRFQQGKLFTISKGNYLYIGSALGKSGAPLARRLLRHASRSGEKHHHEIRTAMRTLFSKNDLIATFAIKPSKKQLRWHIDYLLDQPEAEITHIVIIRSPERLEHKISELLEPLEETSALASRLGAQDTRNSTHLLKCTDQKKILAQLRKHIPQLSA